jgi:GT2 family glycosyltransferase
MLVKQYEAMMAGEWEPTARQFYTGNSSLARRLIVESGGFDPAFRRAEDVELAYRIDEQGVRFVFNPQAVGHHYVERSFASWLATPYAYGRNDVIFTRQKGQDWLMPTVLKEYETRHKLIKQLVKLCLDRPVLSRLAIAKLRLAAWLFPSMSRLAFSGIFNLRYYQGLADELNGRAAFYGTLAAQNNKTQDARRKT